MQRFAIWVVLAATLGSGSLPAQEKKKSADIFIRAADAGPDFEIQGEYEAIGQDKMGAQVVALGNGSFDVYLLTGGLPGADWDQKFAQKCLPKPSMARCLVARSDQGVQGTIADGKLVTTDKAGLMTTFKRVLRQSPTLGAKPPDGAVVLFDGTSVDEWNGGKLVEDNLLNCGTSSKKKFATGKLHVEFRTPFMPKGAGRAGAIAASSYWVERSRFSIASGWRARKTNAAPSTMPPNRSSTCACRRSPGKRMTWKSSPAKTTWWRAFGTTASKSTTTFPSAERRLNRRPSTCKTTAIPLHSKTSGSCPTSTRIDSRTHTRLGPRTTVHLAEETCTPAQFLGIHEQ